MKSSIKAVALPKEHGAWGYVLEPFVLVLVVAFSLPGLYLMMAAFLFFLAHRPTSLVARPRNQTQNYLLSIGVSLVYIVGGLLMLVLAFPLLSVKSMLLFGSGTVIMVGYLVFDIYKKKRSLIAEQVVPVALSLMALSVPALAGWPDNRLIAFFFLLLTRPVPTTFYIHTRLKLDKGVEYSANMVYFSHSIALAYAVVAAFNEWIPKSLILAVSILTIRAVRGISPFRKRQNVKQLGIMEFGYGILFVLITAAGYILKI
ncbi:MAG TPA: hypothetical protein EYP36_09565 [Calditrichaeota bacterium]|nr:hypothetical protein [Calditrichota bacterium]